MSIRSAKELMRSYCRPVNSLHLMEAIADDRGIDRSDLRSLIDSGEYLVTLESGFTSESVRRNPNYKPTVRNFGSIDKRDLLNAVNATTVFGIELSQAIKDMKWQSVKCPFHEDNHPSFRILLPDGGFNCMSCDEQGGNVIDFIMLLHRLSFPKAIDYLAHRYTGMVIIPLTYVTV